MNNTAYKIIVMQAYLDGKEIECKAKYREDNWSLDRHPTWSWTQCDYRIKEEKPDIKSSNIDKLAKEIADGIVKTIERHFNG